ncbi:hypothetical protein Acsp02_96910 [Actinoplanes sp. NBRC 103695]|nr:hypothetical protein Acsp02_96910 [Actinoplanes sp. NBRC 103695]
MNQWLKLRNSEAGFNLVDMGRYAAHHLVNLAGWTSKPFTELLGSGSGWCQAAGGEESVREGGPVLHPLEPVLRHLE